MLNQKTTRIYLN